MTQVIGNAPFRADVVGSFLRPAELKEARAKFEKGEISGSELKAVEDRLITELIAEQKAHGLKVITDGEFRRAYWHLDFFWGFYGVEHIELEHGYQFHGVETTKGSLKLTGKISGENPPWVEHFKFIKQFESEGVVARQTMPAPAQFLAELYRGKNTLNTKHFYPREEDLFADIAKAYQQVFSDLAAAGCTNIQLDDCTWGMIVDDDFWKSMAGTGFTVQSEAERYLKLNNLALANRPEGVTITTHICRGNYFSTYATKGPYDLVAPYVFAQQNVDAFYLEFDDERSGSFEPLRHVPAGKKVVVGVITSKRAELEDRQAVIARINEAAQYVPLADLCLSPQCGFASCEIGNRLTAEEQWAKVDLVVNIAKEVWG